MGLTADDVGVDEHQFLSELFEAAQVYDQLNGSELVCLEMASRRFMLWEECYSSLLQESELGADGASFLDERRLFLGSQRSRGKALVMPELEEYVSSKLEAESKILKERRKAREERALVREGAPGATGTSPPAPDAGSGSNLQGLIGRRRARGRGR